MADAHDKLSLFAHAVDKLHWNHSSIICLTELFSSCIQCATKSVALHKHISAKYDTIPNTTSPCNLSDLLDLCNTRYSWMKISDMWSVLHKPGSRCNGHKDLHVLDRLQNAYIYKYLFLSSETYCPSFSPKSRLQVFFDHCLLLWPCCVQCSACNAVINSFYFPVQFHCLLHQWSTMHSWSVSLHSWSVYLHNSLIAILSRQCMFTILYKHLLIKMTTTIKLQQKQTWLTIVSRPDARDDIRSLPARAQTIVL